MQPVSGVRPTSTGACMLWFHFRGTDEACGELTLIPNGDGEKAMQTSKPISTCVLLSALVFVSYTERLVAQKDGSKAKTEAPAPTEERRGQHSAAPQPEGEMYGEIGKIIAVSGKRDEVIGNILAGVSNMPGCLSYIVAKDASNPDAIWISEAWDSKASHDASLSLPSVKTAIAKNLRLIAGFGDSVVTMPVGGPGLGMTK